MNSGLINSHFLRQLLQNRLWILIWNLIWLPPIMWQ